LGFWGSHSKVLKERKTKQEQGCRKEGRKFLSESFEENQGKEDPFLNHPFWATFNSPMTIMGAALESGS